MNDVSVGVIGHVGLLRAFFLHLPDKELWACLGDLPLRYAQMAGDGVLP